MLDREKVIKGLEYCMGGCQVSCFKCPYRDIGEIPPDCLDNCRILQDAVELLKESASGWISVKDRLPESAGLKVIVCAKTVQESVLQTKAVFVAFLGYGDGKWYTPDVNFMASAKTMNNHVHPVWEITHWMFPPEPPKENGNESD